MDTVKFVTNFLFNTLAIQDSQTNVFTAHAVRKDSSAMKMIAIMTMLFLPATFVSSLFGTNFFALQVSESGSTTLFVSNLWWVYVICAVPLTLVVYIFWLWFSGRLLKEKDFPAPEERDLDFRLLQESIDLRRKIISFVA